MQNEHADCLKITKHFRMGEQSVNPRAGPVLLCTHILKTLPHLRSVLRCSHVMGGGDLGELDIAQGA